MKLKDIIEIVENAKGRGYSLEDDVQIVRAGKVDADGDECFDIDRVDCSGTHHGRIINLVVGL